MTPMRVGRNDPCPCGSGRKYKHCCLLEQSASVADLHEQTWRRVRQAIDGYAAAMLRFVAEAYGPDALQQAWPEFTIGRRDKLLDSDRFVEGGPHTELFFSWLFHQGSPQAEKGSTIADAALYGVSPTRAYLIRRAGRLDPLLKRYLEACLAAPFGFYEIRDCEAGDRKSTRLNSSHLVISYAVFCLKKKNELHARRAECPASDGHAPPPLPPPRHPPNAAPPVVLDHQLRHRPTRPPPAPPPPPNPPS